MRFMFLNHSYVRHSSELEAHVLKLLKSYASPETTFELAYPEDLGGGQVLSLLEERKALSGFIISSKLRHWSKKPSKRSVGVSTL